MDMHVEPRTKLVHKPRHRFFNQVPTGKCSGRDVRRITRPLTVKSVCKFVAGSLTIDCVIDYVFDGLSGGTYESNPIPYPDRSVLKIKTKPIKAH